MKVITKSIKENISVSLINIIWKYYDEGYQGVELDDYQFFIIETKENKTTLKMWQEIPPAYKVKSIPQYNDEEIWIIDDGSVKTMLLPIDY